MFWYAVTQFLTLLLDVFSCCLQQADKDFEILLLRQQLRILERKLGYKPRISRWKKCLLVVVTVKLLHQTGKGRRELTSLLRFKPETVLKWHRALVQRKWTFKQPRTVGRPATDSELCALAIRFAKENDWAYDKIKSVREECLDRVLIVGERHLRQTLKAYVAYYNTRRPHQGLDQQCPIPLEPSSGSGSVQRHNILGDILHDYYRQEA